MNAIPLINIAPPRRDNETQLRQEVNTSLVALKREAFNLETLINQAAQTLVEVNERITALENVQGDYVKKTEVTDTVQSGNMNPVTSNAVAEQTEIITSSDNSPYVQRINYNYDKAVINKIIGASFPINQVVTNGNFASNSNWGSGAGTVTVSGNVARVTYTSGTAYNQDLRQLMTDIVAGHKYYFKIEHRENSSNPANFGLNELTSNTTWVSYPMSTEWKKVEKVFSPSSANPNYAKRITPLSSVASYGASWFEVRRYCIYDLTKLFGATIADRIYAMEQATEGSGIAWIKSFGFFRKDYLAYNAGTILGVKPSAHKISTSLVKSYVSRNISSQYAVSLYADAIIKPNTTYKLYFRGANGAKVYSNEFLFSYLNITLNGELQSATLTTLSSFPNGAYYEDSFVIFKNSTGNTVVPNFTEFYLVEEGANADPTYSVSYPLANVELNGIPKLDSNNNLVYDGDIYTPDGTVIRKYGVINLGSLTWTRDTVTEGTVTGRFLSSGISSTCVSKSIKSVMSNGFVPKAGQSEMQDKCYRIDNSKNIVITNTAYTDATAFKTAMNGVYLVYELATPTKETVASFSNSQTCIRKGAEEFVDTRTVAIPVGHETKYAKLPSWLSNDSMFI